jgi:hypothetical protein
MGRHVTINEAVERLQQRGVDVSRRTVAAWVQQGLFKGARLESSPAGSYWLVPTSEIDSFQPPKAGRPSKQATATSKKKGGKK